MLFGVFGAILILGGIINAIREHGNGREVSALIYGALALFGVGLTGVPLLKGVVAKPAEAAVTPPSPQIAAPVDPRGSPEQQAATILIGMSAVKSKLKDPWSAQFEQVYINLIENNVPAVCGAVNAKGGFGGYVGWKRFASVSTSAIIDNDEWQFGNVWRQYCEKRR